MGGSFTATVRWRPGRGMTSRKKHQAGLTSVVRWNWACSLLPWDGDVTGPTLTRTVGGPAHKRSWNGIPAQMPSAVADPMDRYYGASPDDEVVAEDVPERWLGCCRGGNALFCASAPIASAGQRAQSHSTSPLAHYFFPRHVHVCGRLAFPFTAVFSAPTIFTRVMNAVA